MRSRAACELGYWGHLPLYWGISLRSIGKGKEFHMDTVCRMVE